MASDIEKQVDVVDGDMTQEQADAPAFQPSYQVFRDSRIPVSKSTGSFWHGRFNEGKAHLENSGTKDRWDEVIRYYQNDQGDKERKKRNLGNAARKSDATNYTTENIVFANISSLIPSIYAKNPDIEITDRRDQDNPRTQLYETLLDTIFSRKSAPGVNIKPKMKRGTTTALLTNIVYFEIAFNKKEQSSDQVFTEIEQLSRDLQEAKGHDKIREIEGKLQALEQRINLLSPAGPTVRVRHPDMVIRDPNCEEADLSDDTYIIIGDYVRTDYLRAVYMDKDNETGEYRSLFEPTHVATASTSRDINGHDDELNSFTLLGEEPDYKKLGYRSENDYRNSCRTLVWYVWDKTTRRVLMFNDKDWSWPIWVWDDPYKLTRFFPLYPLVFYTDPTEQFGRSEVMYYLDQQDEINMINNERAKMRHWAATKYFINTALGIDVSAVDKFLKDDGKTIHGISLPEGMKITDVIGSMPLPSTQFEGLFDTRALLESINRMSSVTPVLQNVQFKTNTTNRAIDSYESSTQGRLDEKIDAIEEVMGDIGAGILEMCVQFFSEEDVINLLGQDAVTKGGGWEQMVDPAQLLQQYSMTIVGGSTVKPTSKSKKEQAAQLGQILGQFASASPVIILVALKMFQRAFNEDFVITDDDWKMIVESVAKATQQADGKGSPEEVIGQVDQMLAQLPPEAKAKVGELIAKGAPLSAIIQELMAKQGGGGGQPQQPQQPAQP